MLVVDDILVAIYSVISSSEAALREVLVFTIFVSKSFTQFILSNNFLNISVRPLSFAMSDDDVVCSDVLEDVSIFDLELHKFNCFCRVAI